MGMLFDRYKVLHGLPKPGQKIKFREAAKYAFIPQTAQSEHNLLEQGQEYTVRDVELNSSSTYVWLEEFPEENGHDVFFNLHSFDWVMPDLPPEDLIGFYVSDLGIVRYKRDIGVEVNGEVVYVGTPVYSITVNSDEKIIAAVIKEI
jgi:hypothetical protein